MATLILLVSVIGCSGTPDTPDKTPLLYISYSTDNVPAQNIQALQLTNGWTVVGNDGKIEGYEADSFHPQYDYDFFQYDPENDTLRYRLNETNVDHHFIRAEGGVR